MRRRRLSREPGYPIWAATCDQFTSPSGGSRQSPSTTAAEGSSARMSSIPAGSEAAAAGVGGIDGEVGQVEGLAQDLEVVGLDVAGAE